ncbi:MAG: hypothetical protein V3S24_15890, partial [Candidatus Tectomicrobia bacterium]
MKVFSCVVGQVQSVGGSHRHQLPLSGMDGQAAETVRRSAGLLGLLPTVAVIGGDVEAGLG